MKGTSRKDKGKLTAEQVSTRVLYALVSLTVIVFSAFFFIGFDIPYEEAPQFNAPLLTDTVLTFIYLLIAATAVIAAVGVVAGLRHRNKSSAVVNNIPAARIAYATVALLCLSLIVTFMLGSTEPVSVNGTDYTDTFWLRATDMFIGTTAVLLTVAAGGVIFGISGYNRKVKLK